MRVFENWEERGKMQSMTQRKVPVTLSPISAHDLLSLAEQFTSQRPRKTPRGRKPLYPEALLLTLALLQVTTRASYRQWLFSVFGRSRAGVRGGV